MYMSYVLDYQQNRLQGEINCNTKEVSPHVRDLRQPWILDSRCWIPDSSAWELGFQIP